jgi:hypothetical protein
MDTTAELLARLGALEAELARVKAQIGHGSAAATGTESELAPPTMPLPQSSRRDLLRYGAAAVGAAAVGLAAQPAEAANGDPIIIGTQNVGSVVTTLLDARDVAIGASFQANGRAEGIAGLAFAANGVGVLGNHVGISGTFQPDFIAVGVLGGSVQPFGTGVMGLKEVGSAPAVHGLMQGGGPAVLGEISWGSTENAIAVYGRNHSSYAGPGPGAGGFGVYGVSVKGHGVVGSTVAPGAAAVVGTNNGVAGVYAGAFFGSVVVAGNFTVVGGAKSAAVPHPDGSHRLLYCIESPESWFEDFGDGELVDGYANITMEAGFAAVADMSAYHVFVTPYDDHNSLYVTDRTVNGFRVRASGGTGCGTFSWRVVAKRKDIAGERLAPIAVPAEPVLPTQPDISGSPVAPRHIRAVV